MVVGVSFLATPVKFAAPSLGLPTALEVGRVTFALFAKVEWVLCALLIGAAVMVPSRRVGLRLVALACLPVLLAIQVFWLLPALDIRVGQIIAGDAIPTTSHHLLYIALEATKALLLVAVSFAALFSLTYQRGASHAHDASH